MTRSYSDLVRLFPLVPIKSERQYEAAVAFLQPLAVRDAESFDQGEQAYLEALTQFVEDYEQRHYRIEAGNLGAVEALKYRMQVNDMKPADLGRLLGSRSVASQILSGKRGLSKSHIVALAERFKVEPGLFLSQD